MNSGRVLAGKEGLTTTRLASSAKRRPAARKAAMTRRLWPTTWKTVSPARCRSRDRRARRAPGESAAARVGKPRTRPAADDDARAWNPRLTCQGCRLITHASLDERGLCSVWSALRTHGTARHCDWLPTGHAGSSSAGLYVGSLVKVLFVFSHHRLLFFWGCASHFVRCSFVCFVAALDLFHDVRFCIISHFLKRVTDDLRITRTTQVSAF